MKISRYVLILVLASLALVFLLMYPPLNQYYVLSRSKYNYDFFVFDSYNQSFVGFGPVVHLGRTGVTTSFYIHPVGLGVTVYHYRFLGLFVGSLLPVLLIVGVIIALAMGKRFEGDAPRPVYEDQG